MELLLDVPDPRHEGEVVVILTHRHGEPSDDTGINLGFNLERLALVSGGAYSLHARSENPRQLVCIKTILTCFKHVHHHF